jgi:hypothetical protein
MMPDARLLELAHKVYLCSRNTEMASQIKRMERTARQFGFEVQIDRKRKAVSFSRLRSLLSLKAGLEASL